MGLGGENDRLYCLDFGLAKLYRDRRTLRHLPKREGSLAGTPRSVQQGSKMSVSLTCCLSDLLSDMLPCSLSAWLAVCLAVCLTVCQSVCLSVMQPCSLSGWLAGWLSDLLSVYLTCCLTCWLSVWMTIVAASACQIREYQQSSRSGAEQEGWLGISGLHAHILLERWDQIRLI